MRDSRTVSKLDRKPEAKSTDGAQTRPTTTVLARKGPRVANARTQEQRRAEAEEKLLAAALHILATKGWDGLTLAEIGNVAGVSRGLASHHFSNKAGLLRAVALKIGQNFDHLMQEAPSAAPGLDSVIRYVSVYINRKDKSFANTRSMLHLMANALIPGSDSARFLASFMDRMFAYLEENIRIGITKGEIHPSVSPQFGAEFVIGAMRGMLLQRLIKNDLDDLQVLNEQVRFVLERAFGSAAERVESHSSTNLTK
jgi:AcrR family transcriptional regulator